MSVTVKSVALKLDTENALLRAEMAKMKADFDERLGLSEKKIENLSARLVLTESTIALQKNTIEVLQGHISLQRDKVENQEQYHRRPNLRINSVVLPKPGESESNEDVMKIVEAVCTDLKVPLQPNDIFRAHRVGPKKTEEGGRRHQAVIVRFRSWQTRCALYKARPTKQRPRKTAGPAPFGYRSIGLDVTPDRYTLLDKSKELISEHFPDNSKVFAYADVNCNLAVRLGDNNVKFFSNQVQLDKIFSDLPAPVAVDK